MAESVHCARSPQAILATSHGCCGLQVELEGLSKSLDYDLLPGKWKLVYTSAPDVAPLVASNVFSSLLPVKIGDIYQEFSTVELGQVKNIITFEFAGLLNSGESGNLPSLFDACPQEVPCCTCLASLCVF